MSYGKRVTSSSARITSELVRKVSKGKGKGRRDARTVLEAIEPALIPLTELFADVDEVFAEDGAFAPENIHKSLGRIYRAWLRSRTALDPDFDPERYRLDQKAKMRSRRPIRVGLSVQPVADLSTPSTDQQSISGKSRKQTAKQEKSSVKKSAKGVRSAGTVSAGRSKKRSRSGSGEA